jgi:putative transposase
MRVHKGHKIQLSPNNKQSSKFKEWCGAHRWAYNFGLERKKKAYKETGKSLSAYSLMKEIVRLKQQPETAWLKDVPKSVPRVALLHLEGACKLFFRRVKESEGKLGFPRFKSRKRSKKVFHLEPETVKVNGKRVWIPLLGWVRMTKPLRFSGKLVGTVAISEYAGKWYVSFNVEVTLPEPIESQDRQAVGVDLNVSELATCSDGTVFENPKALFHYEKLLKKAQRQLSRKEFGSKRWKRAKRRVQLIHKRIADIRGDATHKATSYIADRYNFVAMEDLSVHCMMKNHHIAKAIADANFYEFRRQVEYKLSWSGGKLILISRWFPSSKQCHICGGKNDKLTLKERIWRCDCCGTAHDRDLNAAKNILFWAKKHRMVQTVLDVEGKGIGLPMKRQGGSESISPSPVK